MVAQVRSRCFARAHQCEDRGAANQCLVGVFWIFFVSRPALAELMDSAVGAPSFLPCPFLPAPSGLARPLSMQPGFPSKQSRGSPSKRRRDDARASARQRFVVASCQARRLAKPKRGQWTALFRWLWGVCWRQQTTLSFVFSCLVFWKACEGSLRRKTARHFPNGPGEAMAFF